MVEVASHRATTTWRLRLHCPDAISMNLGFTRWHPPAGTVLRLRDAAGRALMRPFTERDGARHGELWTPPAAGDTIILELTVPAAAQAVAEARIEIGSVNPGYRGFYELQAVGGSLACNVDVACPEAGPWANEVAGVAVISTGGSLFCSGFMVNNVRNDRTPYFMTANHCGINAGNAPSLVAFWNFQNSTCRPPGSAESAGPGDGMLEQFSTGATFRAAYGPSDFTLVELDDPPDPAWGVSYCGFSAVDVAPDGAVGIHHPGAEEKRISFDLDQTAISGYFGGGSTHINVLDWDAGTTEGGSSGSPLFDMNHRVVGQLHGGNCTPQPCDFCDETVFDYYGRIAVSWDGGGTPSTRLRDWLDPDGTGTLVTDTLTASDLQVAPTGNVVHIGPVGGPFSDPSVDVTITNTGDASLEWMAAWSGDAPLLLDGGIGPIVRLLSAGADDTLTVSLDPAALALDAGLYESTLTITGDEGTSFIITHRLEIAQATVAVTPLASALAAGPTGGPFVGGTTYMLENTGSVDATVTIDVDADWIDAGPPSIVIGPGSTAMVPLMSGTAADDLPEGGYIGTARLTNLNGSLDDQAGGRRHLVLDVRNSIDIDICTKPMPVRSGVWPIDTTDATTGEPFDDFEACFNWDQPQVLHDVWYRYEACTSGTLTASTCSTVDWDSRIGIYAGDGCDAVMIACNDDGDGCANYTTIVQVDVAPGPYLIRVGSYAANDTGTGTLLVDGPDDCPCAADVDGDGTVAFGDVIAILAAWGPCPACPEDLDGSGDVGLPDLLAVLTAWGDC